MALKNILPSLQTTVKFANGEFSVRGLSLSDITLLLAFHRERIEEVIGQFVAMDGGKLKMLDPDQGIDFGMAVLQFSPSLAAHIIAQAEVREEGEPPQFDAAIRLPFDVQVEAIDKIARLTFQTEGGAKKVFETVMRAFVSMVKIRTDLAT